MENLSWLDKSNRELTIFDLTFRERLRRSLVMPGWLNGAYVAEPTMRFTHSSYHAKPPFYGRDDARAKRPCTLPYVRCAHRFNIPRLCVFISFYSHLVLRYHCYYAFMRTAGKSAQVNPVQNNDFVQSQALSLRFE